MFLMLIVTLESKRFDFAAIVITLKQELAFLPTLLLTPTNNGGITISLHSKRINNLMTKIAGGSPTTEGYRRLGDQDTAVLIVAKLSS